MTDTLAAILADKALLVAYGEGAIQVSDKHAEAAAWERDSDNISGHHVRR